MGLSLSGATILITGGAGFIGSHIADRVIAAGATRTIVVDDLVRGRIENLKDARSSGRLELVVGDIRDAALIDQVTSGVDLIFHQAALRITQAAEDPVRAIDVMVHGTQNVLEAAVRHRVKKILAASSASVYGEPSYLPMDEAHPFNNRTVYGAAKIANEQMLRAYAETYGLRYLALRPFNVYGPRMDVFGLYTEVMIRWLELLFRNRAPVIFGDGSPTMDFVYVEDVAEAYCLAAVADASDQVYNVGAGKETSLLELCRTMCEETGQPDLQPEFAAARNVNAVSRRRADISRARDEIGFETRRDLRSGLRELIKWFEPIAAETALRAG